MFFYLAELILCIKRGRAWIRENEKSSSRPPNSALPCFINEPQKPLWWYGPSQSLYVTRVMHTAKSVILVNRQVKEWLILSKRSFLTQPQLLPSPNPSPIHEVKEYFFKASPSQKDKDSFATPHQTEPPTVPWSLLLGRRGWWLFLSSKSTDSRRFPRGRSVQKNLSFTSPQLPTSSSLKLLQIVTRKVGEKSVFYHGTIIWDHHYLTFSAEGRSIHWMTWRWYP